VVLGRAGHSAQPCTNYNTKHSDAPFNCPCIKNIAAQEIVGLDVSRKNKTEPALPTANRGLENCPVAQGIPLNGRRFNKAAAKPFGKTGALLPLRLGFAKVCPVFMCNGKSLCLCACAWFRCNLHIEWIFLMNGKNTGL
jgi:hypothetical protein